MMPRRDGDDGICTVVGDQTQHGELRVQDKSVASTGNATFATATVAMIEEMESMLKAERVCATRGHRKVCARAFEPSRGTVRLG